MSGRRVVLLIEDDDDLRNHYRQVIRLAGYVVHDARSGFEALRTLDSIVPDLIVLDLVMPGMDGRTVRSELAASPRSRHIPIVVVTGTDATARDLDVRYVLRKPVSSDRLLAAIAACLEGEAL